MLISKDSEDKVLTFVKYANFLSKKFSVKVVFDGLKAETDGQTIKLPNLSAFQDEELDFLYGILLHEIGHVKFTDQSLETAQRIKSKNHFLLANFIEDARVENLLMKEFDGAESIFNDLYNKFSADPNFIKKIFKFDIRDSDFLSILGVYLHNYLIKLNKKPSILDLFQYNAKYVLDFVNNNGVTDLLNSEPLDSWKDSISLARKIYDLIFNDSKDLSEENRLPEVIKGMRDLIDVDLVKIKEDQFDLMSKIESAKSALNDVKEELAEFKIHKRLQRDELTFNMDKLGEHAKNIESYLDLINQMGKQNAKKTAIDLKIQKKEAKLDKTKSKIEVLDQKANKKPKDDEKILKLKQTQIKEQESLNALKLKQKEIEENLSSLETEKNTYSQEIQSKIIDELTADLILTNKELVDSTEKVLLLRKEYADLCKKKDQLKQELQELKEIQKRGFSSEIKEIQNKINELKIDINVIPGFHEVEGWEAANEVQMEFDQQAEHESGKIVTNGRMVSKGSSRDLISVVDRAQKELSDFNLLDHFSKDFSSSKINSFNDFSLVLKNESQSDGQVLLQKQRRHIPASVAFDSIHYQTGGNSSSIKKIKKDNEKFINSLKLLFRQRMKFLKKEKFKGNQEDGLLDQRSLWMLATKTDQNFFEIIQPKYLNQVAATIAIDISGSMNQNENVESRVKELAVFLSEALKSSFIKHEIVGYHAPVNHRLKELDKNPIYNRNSNSLDTVIYNSFNSNNNEGLANLKFQATDNSDGESLRLVGKRLLRERSKRKILFLITDGKPFLTDSNIAVLDQDLKDSISYLKSNKVEIIAIGFNDQGKLFYGDDYLKVLNNSDLFNFCLRKL